jgi:VWFA-related protein
VPTTVFDPDGHGYVNGLRVSDFQVLDNGKPQKISGEITEQPLSVVLAVQANSEVDALLPDIKKSWVLLHGLVTGQQGDVAILAFDHRMQVMQNFTGDVQKIDDAMYRITSGSSTAAMIDAVMKADQMLRDHDRQNARRRVVILMSRNIDKGSQLKLEEAIHQMQFDNVIVYCVDISRWRTALMKKPDYPRPANGGVPPEALGTITGIPQSDTSVLTQADGNLLNAVPPALRSIRDLFKKTPAEALTYFTGGNLYGFHDKRGLEAAITDIGQNLNSQYLLSYALSDETRAEPGFHTIKVVVNRPGLQVRTRPGYWLGGGKEP